MAGLYEQLIELERDGSVDKQTIVESVQEAIQKAGYTIAERNDAKPWGAYFRIKNDEADKFTPEFFDGMTADEARLGIADAPLSPKILIVSPGQRLSEQLHYRRAERWHFLTNGSYVKAKETGQNPIGAEPGDIIQFEKGDIHRLVGLPDQYVLVAEVWQHTDVSEPSDEDDIERFADDYQR